jgi:HSP20 family molecular chaperone IbpA
MLTKYANSVFVPDIFDGSVFRFIDDFYAREKQHSYDVTTSENHLTLSLDLPGAKQSDLKIVAEGRNIKISGKQKGKEFKYSYCLDKQYEPENAVAKLEDGVLTIKFEKKGIEKQKSIEIKIE